jgi:hypothetical protein
MSVPVEVTTAFYVEVEPVKRGASIVGAHVRRMTKGLPSLDAGNIAVRVELTVPFEAFHPLSVGLVVEPSRSVLAAEHGEVTP